MKLALAKRIILPLIVVLLSWPPLASSAPKPLVISINANIALYWPNFAADKYGFIAKEKVAYETVIVGNAAQQLQQLIGGSIDVAYTNCDLALKAKDKGGDVVIVGETVRTYPYTIMSAPDVHTAKDLEGKKVILPFKTSLLTIFLNRWLQENGADPARVDQVFDGATPNRYAALRNGIVSAAVVSQPFDFRAKKEGFNQYLSYSKLGDFAFVCAIVNRAWAQQNGDTLRAYFRGMSNAMAWLNDPANRSEAITLLAEVSKQPQHLVEQTYDYYFNEMKPYSPGLEIGQVGMQKLLDTLKETKDVSAHWTVKDFIDTSYLPK